MTDSTKPVHITAALLMVFVALLWSTGGLLIKWISWTPMAIAGTRSLLAIPVLLIFFRKAHLNFSPVQVAASLCYAVNVILFVISMKLTTAANAILLQYTAPVYVAIFSGIFLHERITKLDWTMIVVALSGMSLFFMGRLTVDNYIGNICAVFAGISFAFYIIFMRKQKNASPIGSALLGNIITAAVALPFMFRSAPAATSYLPLILLGTLQLGLSHALYSKAIKQIPAFQSVMISMIEPILNPIWVFIFLAETPNKYAITGGIIVLTTIITHTIKKYKIKPFAVNK